MTYVISLITGLIFGAAYTLLKLPLPAPPTLAGVIGIFGVWLGFYLVTQYL